MNKLPFLWYQEDRYEYAIFDTYPEPAQKHRRFGHPDTAIKAHILFEFLDLLGIIEYMQNPKTCYETWFEIRIKK